MGRHRERRVSGAEARRQLGRDAGLRAKQEEPESTPGADRRQRLDQVGAGNRTVNGASLPPGRPYDPGAVGKTEVGGFQDTCELSVALCAHDKLGIDCGDLMHGSGANETFDPVQGLFAVQAVDPHAEDSSLGQDAMRRLERITDGMGTPRFVTNSLRVSPPPTRTRPQVYRLSRLCMLGPSSITAVS